jgi:hypothetical protein
MIDEYDWDAARIALIGPFVRGSLRVGGPTTDRLLRLMSS